MKVEDIRKAVAGERAATPQLASVGQNYSSGLKRERALSGDALEAMCQTVRVAAFEDGYQHGMQETLVSVERRLQQAREDGETAGAVAALSAAIDELSIDEPGAVDRLIESLGEIRANGLHGEREF